ncbi:unnamed protein product, partial [Arctia plantaginis]
EEVIYHRNIRF